MTSSPRRLLPLVLIAGLLLSAAPPVAATTSPTDLAAAETTMLGLLNAQRSAIGLVPLRLDTRLTAIARARSTDMATKGYFAHQQPDGKWVWDLMTAAGIKWYYAGEIIGRTGGLSLSASITAVNSAWHNSADHYALLTSTTYNYLGVGVAEDATGRFIWTTVFIKGPDRTGAKSYFTTTSNASVTAAYSTSSSTKHLVTIRWTGADVKLQTLTAGLLDYRVQYRLAGTTTWYSFVTATTATSTSRYLYAGRVYEFQVRARDKKYNYGDWSASLVLMP